MMHSRATIYSTAQHRPLNSLENAIFTTSMTIIRPGRDWNRLPYGVWSLSNYKDLLESRRLWVQSPHWHSSSKETKRFFPAHSWKFHIVGSLFDREVACSTSRLEFRIMYLEGRVISFISPSSWGSLTQFSLHVHKGGLKPHSFHFKDVF